MRPLVRSLESQPTVERVCRHLGYNLPKKNLLELGVLIKAVNGGPYKKIKQRENHGSFNVIVYPPDFIPVMIGLTEHYCKVNKIDKTLTNL